MCVYDRASKSGACVTKRPCTKTGQHISKQALHRCTHKRSSCHALIPCLITLRALNLRADCMRECYHILLSHARTHAHTHTHIYTHMHIGTHRNKHTHTHAQLARRASITCLIPGNFPHAINIVAIKVDCNKHCCKEIYLLRIRRYTTQLHTSTSTCKYKRAHTHTHTHKTHAARKRHFTYPLDFREFCAHDGHHFAGDARAQRTQQRDQFLFFLEQPLTDL